MPTIPNNTVIIQAICKTKAGFFRNVSYWEPVTPPTSGTNCNTIAQDFAVQFGPAYGNVMNLDCKFLGAIVDYVNAGVQLTGSDATSAAGVMPNNAVSDQNAVVIRKITGMSGRQNAGRYFVGGMDSNSFDQDDPDEVEPGAALPVYQALAALYGSDKTFNGVIHHARHWDRKDNAMRVVTECRVTSRVASRRDRRRHAIDVPE